jgi:hypothetical protein
MTLVHGRTIPSDRRSSAKLVPTFADRGCTYEISSRITEQRMRQDWGHYVTTNLNTT